MSAATFARLTESIDAQRRALGALLREIRMAADLRQADVAERLALPQSFVSKYETGERRLDVLELRAVSHALGLSFPEFVVRMEEALASKEDAP